MRRAFKTVIINAVTQFWAACFALLGRSAHSTAPFWTSRGGQQVLVIAPHPDDEAIGCGGTLLKHKQQGDRVTIFYVTDGRGSRALGLSAENMALRREEEAYDYATRLACDHIVWLGLREGEWDVGALQEALTTILVEQKPQIIYAPSCIDFHPEHRKVAATLATSLHENPTIAPTIRSYQIHTPLGTALTNFVSPIDQIQTALAESLRAYVTQEESIRKAQRLQQYAAKYFGAGSQAEVFWQLSAGKYSELHQPQAMPIPAGQFRGLYPRPFTDPLAFMVARRWRIETKRRCSS